MKKIIGVLLTGLLATTNADAIDFGVGVKVGTVGSGLDLSIALTRTINARVSLTGVNIDDQNETITVGDPGGTGDILAVMNFDYGANALLLDWYMFDGTFHLTGGMLKNNGRVGFSGSLQNAIQVNGQTLDPSDMEGPITGAISLAESYQPYLGFGWGRKAGDDSGFSLSIEVGVALLDPNADLSATIATGSSYANQAALDDAIDGVASDVNADLDQLEAWPIISLGLNYAF